LVSGHAGKGNCHLVQVLRSFCGKDNVLVGLKQQLGSNLGHPVEKPHSFLCAGRQRHTDDDPIVLSCHNSCLPSGGGVTRF